MSRYILAIDQSTQGTKGLLFDESGRLTARADRSHRQIVNSFLYFLVTLLFCIKTIYIFY